MIFAKEIKHHTTNKSVNNRNTILHNKQIKYLWKVSVLCSMSAVKRKREEVDSYPSKIDWSRSALRTISTGIDLAERHSKTNHIHHILNDGSILEISDQSLILYFNIVESGVSHLRQNNEDDDDMVVSLRTDLLVPVQKRTQLMVQSSKREGQLFPEIVCVSSEGTVQFWQPRETGQQVSTSFTMMLADIERDERIIYSLFENGKVFLLSSMSNIYLVCRDDDNDVQGFLFQQSISLMAGLWKTGARLLGVEQEERVGNALKLIALPQNSLLLNIGSKLTIWQKYSSLRKESILLEMELSAVLKSDIAKALRIPSYSLRMQLIDAQVTNVTTTTADLFLLTAFVTLNDLQSQHDPAVSASLYVHLVQISLLPGESIASNNTVPTGRNPLRVLRRYHIADRVMVPEDISAYQGCSNSGAIIPRLWVMETGWRVFLTWSDVDTRQLHAVQVDTYHDFRLPEPASISSEEEKKKIEKYAVSSVEHGVMNLRVAASEVAAINTVSFVDGCVMITSRPTQFSIISPVLTFPLPMQQAQLASPPRRIPISTSVESLGGLEEMSGVQHQPEQLEGLLLDKTVAHLSDTLMDILSNKAPLFSQLGYLRNEVLRLPDGDLTRIVHNLSDSVINRSPAGRYWGSSLSFRGKSVDNKVKELQFAHRVVTDKVVLHGHFMQIMWELYGFHYAAVAELLYVNQDKIALAAAIAEAVEERMLAIADQEIVKVLLEEIAQAMEDAVLELSGRSLEEILSKGLTPYDFFFADCSKAFELWTNVLQRLTLMLTRAHWPPSLAMQLLSFLVSVFRTAETQGSQAFDEYHSTPADSKDNCNIHHLLLRYPDMRHACVTLVQHILQEVIAHTDGDVNLAQKLIHVNEELDWLAAFAETVFSSYICEANLVFAKDGRNSNFTISSDEQVNAAVEAMPRIWKVEYETAKRTIISLMLSYGYHDVAFRFSRKFWYFQGLFDAVELSPSSHKGELDSLLLSFGDFRNSAVDQERCLTRQYCEWLERTQQHQRLVLDSEQFTSDKHERSAVDNSNILYEFLTGVEKHSSLQDVTSNEEEEAVVMTESVPFDPHRHHIHMLQCLRRKDYASTTQAALAHAQTLTNLLDQKSVLSFGKLAAIVAQRKLSNVSENQPMADLEEEQLRVQSLRTQAEECLKLPIIQEQHFSEEAKLLSPSTLAHRLLHERFVPLTEQVLCSAHPRQSLKIHREEWLQMISHVLILLGYHHFHCAVVDGEEDTDSKISNSIQRLLELLWEKIVEMECLALEDMILYQGPITSVQETALVNESLLAAVVTDAMIGMQEGNLPQEFILPVHATVLFGSIVQKVLSYESAIASETSSSKGNQKTAELSHPIISTWKKHERERVQMLMQNVVRLVLA